MNAIVFVSAVAEKANRAGRDPEFKNLAAAARRRLREADRRIRDGIFAAY